MAKLILSMDGLVLKEIPLNKNRLTIGRKPHNDVQIDNLAISGEHAAVVTILEDSFLEDLNSTNGTMVNGQPVKKHFLRNNDIIEMGKYKLKYLVDSPSSARQESVGTTSNHQTPTEWQLVQDGPPTRSHVGTASQPRTPSALRPASIQVLNGANAGKELELSKTLTTLGKPGQQVAVIARRPNGYFITHVEGVMFPVVNGTAIDTQAQLLNDHDVVEIAGIKMEFFLKG
jgi:pSer/pThr/pTyr-binding forkhead associated (FHA) protein